MKLLLPNEYGSEIFNVAPQFGFLLRSNEFPPDVRSNIPLILIFSYLVYTRYSMSRFTSMGQQYEQTPDGSGVAWSAFSPGMGEKGKRKKKKKRKLEQ